MIVFIDKPDLIPVIIRKTNSQCEVFNFTSLYSGYRSLSALATSMHSVNNSALPTNLFVETVEFDMNYANAILNNPLMFQALMNIMVNSYQGKTVILLVHREPYRDALMESLIKFIQQRYGYNAWIVNDIDDISCIREVPFTPYGITTLDEDIKRYDDMYLHGAISENVLGDACVE